MAEFIASSIVAIIGVLIGMWIHKSTSSSKYEDMVESYDSQIKDLKREIDYWHNEFKTMFAEANIWKKKATCDDVAEAFAAVAKLGVYEQLFDKFLNGPTKHTDSVIVIDGKTYTIGSYTLDHNPGESDTLTIECSRINVAD